MAPEQISPNKRKRVNELEKAEEDVAFPRGGGSILTPLEHKQIQVQATRDVLFESLDTDSASKSNRLDGTKLNKRRKINIKNKSTLKKKASKELDDKHLKIESLNYKQLVTGSLVLCQVLEIHEFEITLALPNNLTGYVPITSISNKLTERVEAITSVTEDEDDQISSTDEIILGNLFETGQYLRAYVVSTSNDNIKDTSLNTAGKTKKRIELSLRPQDSNASLDPQNIVTHCTLMASVISIEDYGVVLDLGLSDTSIMGFMSSKEIGSGREQASLLEGTVLLCIVIGSSSNGKTIKLSADPVRFGNSKNNYLSKAPSVEVFLPGSVVETLVTETSTRGLAGKVMGMIDVTADLIHSRVGCSEKYEQINSKVGSKVISRVICTFPKSDSPKLGISILDHILSFTTKQSIKEGEKKVPLDILPLSSFVDGIIVTKIVPKIGLFVDVGVQGTPGFVHISRISDNKIEDLSEYSGSYKLGSSHRGRVVGFNPIDGLFNISLQASIMEQPFLRIEDLQVGGIVCGKIEKLIINSLGVTGLIVKLADGISGLVPETHISDVKLLHPERKFKEGTTVKARILSIDTSKRQIRLTLKKSLVNSEATLFLKFEDIKPRMQSPGTIIKIIPTGAVVQFYGNVRGFLPVAEMSEAYIRHPSQHFHIGQVVNVHVLDVDPEKERMTVSCKDPSHLGLSQQDALQKLEIGEIVSARVLGKSEEDIQVVIESNKLQALIPVGHLTDGSNSKNLSSLSKIRVGGILTDLVVLQKVEKQRLIILTNKPSLVKDAKNHSLIRSFDDVRLHAIVHGFVRNITPSSVFVQFGASVTGFLSKTKLHENSINLPSFGMVKMQSVTVKVISIDYDQQQFQLSLKDVNDDINPGLADQIILHPIDQNIRNLNDIKIGICTKAKITSVKETQINVQLGDNIKGRIDVSQVFDSWDSIKDCKRPLKSFSPKQIIDVRVLGIHDARKHCFLPFTHRRGITSVFELSAKPSDLTGKPKEILTLDKVNLKSSWISFVNNVTDDCLWVNLTPNIRGRIAALDISDDVSKLGNLESKFPIGSALRVHVINVNLENNRLDLSARPLNSDQLNFDNLSVGMVVPGKVAKILESYILVQLADSLYGQVHLTDLADDFSEADPRIYSKNDIISVCVCDIETSSKNIRLSTRPSRVLNSSLVVQDPDISSIDQLKVNDLVRGFIKNVSDKGVFISIGWKITAYVRVSDLSDSYLKDWRDHFKISELVKGKIISVDQSLNRVQISLKTSVLESDYKPPKTFETLKVGQFITGKVRKVEDYGIFIIVDGSENLSGLCHKSELADKRVHDVRKLYEIGDTVKAVVLRLDYEKRRVNFGLKTSYFLENGSIDDDELSDSESTNLEINKNYASEDHASSIIESVVMVPKQTKTIVNSPEISSPLPDEEKLSLEDPSGISALDAGGFNWTPKILDQADILSSGISETSDVEEGTKKTRSRKVGISVDKTSDLDFKEPNSVNDYERHLLGQPDSSQLWIQYMAFLIQLGDINKAKEVAERAISTINIQEETEKLNVWVALLNLENSYGSEEALEEVFKRACLYNNAQEIYERLASIFIISGKYDKADKLFETLVKKFSHSPAVWYNYAHFLHVTISSPDRARSLLPRATQCLPPHTHLNLTMKFAALEFHSPSGSPERGRTVIEGLLATFPKRFDIWNQLLNLEVQQGDVANIRGVFQRVVKTKTLKPKRAKAWFKRWSEWEERNGDSKSCEHVKAEAEAWVKSASRS